MITSKLEFANSCIPRYVDEAQDNLLIDALGIFLYPFISSVVHNCS